MLRKLVLGLALLISTLLNPKAVAWAGSPPSPSPTPVAVTQSSEKLRLVNQDGTIYLTTELEAGTAVTTQTNAVDRAPRRNLAVTPIQIPRGFAVDFTDLINAVLSWVMVVTALLVFFYLIWGGFDWITSGGDKGKTEKARSKIMAAVIGLIIVAASYAVVNLVVRFLGFAGLNDVFTNMRTIDGSDGGRPAVITTSPTPRPATTHTPSPSPSPITIRVTP
jgi:hypothetical protein